MSVESLQLGACILHVNDAYGRLTMAPVEVTPDSEWVFRGSPRLAACVAVSSIGGWQKKGRRA
eukprot:2760202-Prorocentrum_lima.AAC.1